LIQTLVDSKNRNSAQVNAMLGLKFVEEAIPGQNSVMMMIMKMTSVRIS
jgi:hypothetical protein